VSAVYIPARPLLNHATYIAAVIVRLQRLTDVMDIHRFGANEDPVD
jgi:hypothetical protein